MGLAIIVSTLGVLLGSSFKSKALPSLGFLQCLPQEPVRHCCAGIQINNIAHDSLVVLVKHEERR